MQPPAARPQLGKARRPARPLLQEAAACQGCLQICFEGANALPLEVSAARWGEGTAQ